MRARSARVVPKGGLTVRNQEFESHDDTGEGARNYQSDSPIIEGSGGGKPNMAQAGGKAPGKLAEALAKVRELVKG